MLFRFQKRWFVRQGEMQHPNSRSCANVWSVVKTEYVFGHLNHYEMNRMNLERKYDFADVCSEDIMN